MSTVEERLKALEEVHTSRRGPEGAPGRSVVGPQGPIGQVGKPGVDGRDGKDGKDGKDANVGEVVALASQHLHLEFENAQALMQDAIVVEMKNCGLINPAGRAILMPGPPGRDGVDSQVPGPVGAKGDKGDSVVGLTGQDSVVPGPKGDKGDSVKGDKGDKGDSVKGDKGDKGDPGLDSVVPGPKGDKGESVKGDKGDKGDTVTGPQGPQGVEGIRGQQGKPGNIDMAVAAAEREALRVVREEFAKFKVEILALLKK